jgi:hypothetical protein
MARKAKLDLMHNQGTASYSNIGRIEMCDYWDLFHVFKMVHGIIQLDAATVVAVVMHPFEWTEGNYLDTSIIVKYVYCYNKKGKLVITVMLLRVMNWC